MQSSRLEDPNKVTRMYGRFLPHMFRDLDRWNGMEWDHTIGTKAASERGVSRVISDGTSDDEGEGVNITT